jgi:hypothetical protein
LLNAKRTQDRIHHQIQLFPHILGQKAQHSIAVLLQQQILVTVSPVGGGIGQMLTGVGSP